jgi:hypothetical protein
MKLIAFLVLLNTVNLKVFAQEFDGIKIDGEKDKFIKTMAAKGYVMREDRSPVITFSGNDLNPSLTIAALYTPKAKIICRLFVMSPVMNNWSSLKDEYEKYLVILQNKYGKPSTSFDFFKNPYKEGDGNEITAVVDKGCVYKAFWVSTYGLSVEIMPSKQIWITYENTTNVTEYQKELKEAEQVF